MIQCEIPNSAIACYQCVCITWWSIFGLVIPSILILIYLPRTLSELSTDEWVILFCFTGLTYASKVNHENGMSVSPWMLYLSIMWACIGATSDKSKNLRSLPTICTLIFISLAVPDVVAAFIAKPDGKHVIPGGRGLLDGLIIHPATGGAITWLSYWLKIHPILPNRRRRGKNYDDDSIQFLMNFSPWYRRPTRFDGVLNLS